MQYLAFIAPDQAFHNLFELWIARLSFGSFLFCSAPTTTYFSFTLRTRWLFALCRDGWRAGSIYFWLALLICLCWARYWFEVPGRLPGAALSSDSMSSSCRQLRCSTYCKCDAERDSSLRGMPCDSARAGGSAPWSRRRAARGRP